jgi:Flp pilus assembly protein TadD
MACGLLMVLTTILYWPVSAYPFVNFDDQLYVYQNSNVLAGLSWSGFKWSLTAVVAANWHPLTLLSHMADCSIYHQFAGGHHLTNIVFHSINAALLCLLVKRMTGTLWTGFLVAALFAWHPINVESVAWVSERKNVLSTFFLLLILLAYLDYAKRPRPGTYLLTLGLFLLGLAAKPMLVTAPILLCLLDYWPLGRVWGLGSGVWGKLVLEKIPFLFFAVADCVITYLAQDKSGSIVTTASIPLLPRLLNVPVAYLTYLEKAFWPSGLCIFYAYPQHPMVAPAIISALVLLAVSGLAWHWRVRYPWFLVGWLWFLASLVPVIGLVQTGLQAWADRHAYVPLIGIFLIVACALGRFNPAPGRSWPRLAAGVFLGVCLMLTRLQISTWQNSVSLFERAVAVNPANAVAQNLLGAAYNGQDDLPEAIEHFTLATQIEPHNPEYQYNLGRGLVTAGKFAEAEMHLREAVVLAPGDPVMHNTLGVAFMQSGEPHKAEKEFSQAIVLRPDYSKSYFNLGKALLEEGQAGQAITNLTTAVHLESNWPEAWENLAKAYASAGDVSNAVSTATIAWQLAQSDQQPALTLQISNELDAYKSGPLR